MPKANKHAEVKPSKYKTSLCQFFVKGETCPFAERCAFAHGEAELQSEDKNLELLKATGLQRLDRGGLEEVAPASITGSKAASVCDDNHSKSVASLESPTNLSEEQRSRNSSRTDSFSAAPTVQQQQQPFYSPTSARPLRQRRPVMVSLPKYTTTNDHYENPYCAQQETYDYARFSLQQYPVQHQAPDYTAPLRISRHPEEPLQPVYSQRPQCACGFAATCRQDQPTTYRHNPYGRVTMLEDAYF